MNVRRRDVNLRLRDVDHGSRDVDDRGSEVDDRSLDVDHGRRDGDLARGDVGLERRRLLRPVSGRGKVLPFHLLAETTRLILLVPGRKGKKRMSQSHMW